MDSYTEDNLSTISFNNNNPLPMTLTPFFEDENIIKQAKGICYLFTISLNYINNYEKLKITAINFNTNQKFSVEIVPSDLFEKYTKAYFTEFYSDIFKPEATKSSVQKLTDQLVESRSKFVKSLLWFKLLISQAIRGTDKEFVSDIYYVDYNELSTFSKFVKFEPELKLKGEAALILGIGIEGKIEFGIQMPRMLLEEEECKVLGQSDYIKEYEGMIMDTETIDKYSLLEGFLNAESSEGDAERIKHLEKQCEELRLALREIQSLKK